MLTTRAVRLAAPGAAALLALGPFAAPAAASSAAAAPAPAAASSAASAVSAGAQGGEPLPAFTFAGEVLDRAELDFDPTGEFIFPSLLHAGAHLPDPLGEWYLYYAPHENPGGVALAYADSLDGPWTEHPASPLISNSWEPHYGEVSHVSSPDAFWHPEEEQVFLYFHGENTTTRYATAPDGVDFSYGGVAVTADAAGPEVTESSYARVFAHPDAGPGQRYGMFFMDNRNNTRRIRVATSDDAREWQVDPQPLVQPGSAEGANVSSADLWQWHGQHYVVYHASSGNIHARPVDPALSEVGAGRILHEPMTSPPDLGRAAAPQLVTDGQQQYLFYEAGARLTATIAYAVAGPDAGGSPGDDPLYAQCPGAGSDEFDGAALDRTIWTRLVRESDSRHQLAGGKLALPTYPSGVSGAPLIQQPVPGGQWEATVEVAVDPTATYQQAGLLLYADDANYAKADLVFGGGGLTVEFIHRRDGSDRNTAADSFPAPENLGDRAWFRMTSDGEQVTASLSVDGEEFNRLGRPVALADLAATHIGPYAMQGATGAEETTAQFGWFRFTPTAAELAACQPPPDGGSGGGDDPDRLPVTGGPVTALVLAAAVLLIAGAALLRSAVRRSHLG